MDLVADENVPQAVIRRLREDGHSVFSISEQSFGITDVQVMAQSHSRTFILITHDRDFGELAVAQGLAVTGVVLLETERLTLPGQADRVAKCLADSNATWVGRFSVIEPARVRQRVL